MTSLRRGVSVSFGSGSFCEVFDRDLVARTDGCDCDSLVVVSAFLFLGVGVRVAEAVVTGDEGTDDVLPCPVW